VYKNFRLLDKSTWTLSAILIALILLSSLSFTGTLSDTDSKIIDNTGLLLHHQFKMLLQQILLNNLFRYYIKMPACQSWHFLYKYVT
jgi:hypothetical protein